MSARCIECGTVPSVGARYCPACGASLAERPVERDKGSALADVLGTGYEVVFLAGAVFAVLWAPQVIALRRSGFAAHDVSRLLFEPTWRSPFWRHPKIAALLVAPAATTPHRPADYLRAISDIVRQAGGASTPVGAAAVALAKKVLLALERLDAEVVDLRPQADPSDRARLEERLAALGEPRSGEAEEKRQFRDVLQRQLDLSVRLSTLLEERAAARSRLVDLLDRIWRDVQRLASTPGVEAEAVVASWRSRAEEIDRTRGGPGSSPTQELSILERRS